jgi:hypothetical protein
VNRPTLLAWRGRLAVHVDQAQHERVLVTRRGKPAVLIIGVGGEDFEDLMTRSDPEFWQMNQLLGIREGKRRIVYPAFQLDGERVVRDLPAVLMKIEQVA